MLFDELFYFSYPYEYELTLLQAIMEQDDATLVQVITSQQSHETNLKLSCDLARKNTLALFTSLSRSLYESKNNTQLQDFNCYLLHHLSSCETLADVHALQFKVANTLLEQHGSHHTETKLIFEIKQYVKSHLKTPLTVEQIASEFGYSISYLSKVFGQSLKSYILSEKIKLAKSLLTTTDMSVSDISTTLCFYRTDYFSRVFKQQTNLTPKHYRALYRLK